MNTLYLLTEIVSTSLPLLRYCAGDNSLQRSLKVSLLEVHKRCILRTKLNGKARQFSVQGVI